AMAKAVVAARLLLRALAGLAIDDESRVPELAARIVGEHRREVLPSLGRVAEAVAGGDLARDAAALEVVDRGARFLELGAVVSERVEHARGERRRFRGPVAARARLRHGHADRLGERADRLRIGE